MKENFYKFNKGFSLTESLVSMLIISLAVIAAVPFIAFRENLLGSHRDAEMCVVNDGGNPASEACRQFLNDCRYNKGNSCDTVLYLVENNTHTAYADTAKVVLKEACTNGSEKACDYFVDQCTADNTKCDVAGDTNDLRYFLTLDYDTSVRGKLYLYKKVKKWFDDGIPNIVDEVMASCQANTDSIACKIPSQKIYNFNRRDRVAFYEEDAINGTTFDSGKLTLLENPDQFLLQYGGSDYDYGNSIAVSGGYIYVAGSEMSDSSGGNRDIVVMKLNADGTVVWKNQYGGSDYDQGNSIAVSGGYVYVAGQEASDSDGGSSDIAVMKLNDSDGSVVWKNQYGGSNGEIGYSLAVSGGYIYVTGYEQSDSSGGFFDIAVMKLNETDGSVVWKNQYGGSGIEYGYSLAVSEGYIYVAGRETSDSSGGDYDIAVLKLNDADGSVVWKNQYGGSNGEIGYSLAVSGGYLYVTGVEESDSGGGNNDIFVMKLDESDGTVVWKNQYGGSNADYGCSIAISGGYVYVTGYEASDSDGGSNDIAVMKLNDSDGSVVWKNQYGGINSDYGNSIAVSGGYIYVAGSEMSDSSGGNRDIVVMKLNEDQSSSNITGWTVEGAVSWGLIDDLDGWTVEGAVSWGLIDDLDEWTLEGTTLDDEAIDEWTLEGTTLDDEVIDEWTVGLLSYEGFYVSTADNNSIPDVAKVISAVITEGGETIKWLVSFDGRSQWKKWNGSGWTNATTDLSTYDFSNGNTATEIQTGLTNYTLITGSEDSVDFAVNLSGFAPYVDQVVITYY